MAILVYFPDPLIALQEEIANHEQLMKIFYEFPNEDMPTRIGRIAEYCDIIMDGAYTEGEILHLCDILVNRLKQKRAMILLPSDYKH